MEQKQSLTPIKITQKLSDVEVATLLTDIIEYTVENCKQCISDSVADIIPKNHPQFLDIENKVFEQIAHKF
jgi:hypothetical protein